MEELVPSSSSSKILLLQRFRFRPPSPSLGIAVGPSHRFRIIVSTLYPISQNALLTKPRETTIS